MLLTGTLLYSGTKAWNDHWSLTKEDLESVLLVFKKRRLYTLYSNGEYALFY